MTKDWMDDLVTPEERTGDGLPLYRDTLFTRIATAAFGALAVGMFFALVIYNISRGNFQ